MRLAIIALAVLLSLPAVAADKVTMLLNWLPNGAEPFIYVGIKRGYFAKEGIDLTALSGRGASDVITRLAAGNYQFGSGGIGALFTAHAQSANLPVRAIYSVFNTPPDAIITVKDGPIKSIKDLVGRNLATAAFTASNAFWPIIARANGIDPDQVHLIKVDPKTLAPMLGAGTADAIIDWTTMAPSYAAVLDKTGHQVAILPWSDFGLEGYGLSLFASDQVIRSNPDLVRRFTRAYAESVWQSIADCKAASEDLHATVPEIEVDVAIPQCRDSAALIKNATSEKEGKGVFEPVRLRKTWDWVARSQNYPVEKIDPEKVIDSSFIPQ